MSHTPGPWTVWKGHAQVYGGVAQNTRGTLKGHPHERMPCIARCDDDDDLDEVEQQANAALIAAAPELLFALKHALPFLEALQKLSRGVKEALAIELAEGAIAKAEGRS